MAATITTNAILHRMSDCVPTHPANDDSSDVASSNEAIALLVHGYLSTLSFKLRGFDEDKPDPECESLAPRLPSQWNAGFKSLGFVYSHKQSSMNFVFRIDRMGTKVEIRGLAQGDDKIYRFERTTKDVVDSKNLPVRITIRDGQEDRNDLVDKLRKMFVSDQAIADILHDLKRHIIQKLIPKLQQEGYVEVAEAEETANSERRAQESRNPNPLYRPGNNQPNPHNPVPFSPAPDLARPRRGAPVGDFPPPDFEDEYEINRPPGGGLVMPGRPPLNIGHDDLNPPGLGPHDPLRGSFVPGGIPGGLPRPGGGSGMHPSFDDPLFTGQGGHGGFGQPGFDPQVPPGARWDPTGPQGGPRFPPGGGGGFYGMGRGNGPHGFGGGDII